MRNWVTTVSEAIGAAMISAGVGFILGVGAALICSGVLILVGSILADLGDK